MFLKVGNSILNTNRNKNNIRSLSLIHSKSDLSTKTNTGFFKNYSTSMNYQFQKNIELSTKSQKRANKNNKEKNHGINTNTRYSQENNNLKKFKDLSNNIEFFSYNTKDYIIEANKIINQRIEDKNMDLVGKKNIDKLAILSDTREICRNNYVIDAIKKNMDKIKIKAKDYKTSLIKSQNDMNSDFKNFREFIDSKNNKIKEENITLLKLRDMHDKKMEAYDKELQRYKKLSEDLEKKVKFICLLKKYGSFIYKILGMKFWLEDLPEINHKTKNFEQIADLVIEKYNLLNNKEIANKEKENFFDDNILIFKFKDLEQKIIHSIKSNELKIWELKQKLYMEETLQKMNSSIPKLKLRQKNFKITKDILVKNVDKAKSIKFDEETSRQYLEYIIELGNETEKYDIDANIFFPDLIFTEEKPRKDYDFQYYTIKTLNNLKKKETLINKFMEYMNDIKNSESRDILIEIEQETKNKSKKEKLKLLKIRQQKFLEEKNKKAIERNTRFVVTGRIVPTKFQFTKNKTLMAKKENKVKDDMELLYYNEDEDE